MNSRTLRPVRPSGAANVAAKTAERPPTDRTNERQLSSAAAATASISPRREFNEEKSAAPASWACRAARRQRRHAADSISRSGAESRSRRQIDFRPLPPPLGAKWKIYMRVAAAAKAHLATWSAPPPLIAWEAAQVLADTRLVSLRQRRRPKRRNLKLFERFYARADVLKEKQMRCNTGAARVASRTWRRLQVTWLRRAATLPAPVAICRSGAATILRPKQNSAQHANN